MTDGKTEVETKHAGLRLLLEQWDTTDSRDQAEAVAERVMGWRRKPGYNYWMTPGSGAGFELHALIAKWSPATSAGDDYEVVTHVLAKWSEADKEAFARAVCKACHIRVDTDFSTQGTIFIFLREYRVGAFSRAALAVRALADSK